MLAFCLFKVDEYIDTMPDVTRFKFLHFRHDQVILHEREIRRQTGPFSILRNRDVRTAFMSDLGQIIQDTPTTVIASVIDKARHSARYNNPAHVYYTALAFCLERLYRHLRPLCAGGTTTVVLEARGGKEDDQMELAFRRSCANNATGYQLPFEPMVVSKKSNCSGLQIADMFARPIGLHILRPGQPNRAYDTIEPKLRRSANGRVLGWGLKIFP